MEIKKILRIILTYTVLSITILLFISLPIIFTF